MSIEDNGEFKSKEEKQAAEQFELEQENTSSQNELQTDPVLGEVDAFLERCRSGLSQEESKRTGNGSIISEIRNATQEWKDLAAKYNELSNQIQGEDRTATEAEWSELNKLQNKITKKQAEAISNYNKVANGLLLPNKTEQHSRGEAEKSRQEVDDAYWHMRHAELNGDPDDLTEARSNYKKLSEEHQTRSSDVRQDERDFDDQMSGR